MLVFLNFRIKKRFARKEIEPQEVFLDELAKKNEEEVKHRERKIEVPLPQRAFLFFVLFSFSLVFFLLANAFYFQIIKHNKFLALAEKNNYLISFLKAERGVIFDQAGEQMVFNKPSFDLVFKKKDFEKIKDKRRKEAVLKEVFQILEQNNFDDFKKLIEKPEEEIIVLRNLSQEKLIQLETKISSFSGFEIRKNVFRQYKEGEIFAHLMGYVGMINLEKLRENLDIYSVFDYTGKAGIEKSYEDFLRKKPGKIIIERDVFGNEISRKTIELPRPGNNLKLYLNAGLQRKIYKELINTTNRVGTKNAAAVPINPNNGAVMSLVSLPSFDNNLFAGQEEGKAEKVRKILEDANSPLLNRVVSARYATGSVIKPLIATAALEEKIISPTKLIDDNLGYIEIPHKYNPEIKYIFRDWKPHGWVDLRKAIAESCNVYFYTIGGGYKNQKGLGPTNIKKYLELFIWNRLTGIDIPEEKKGFIPSPDWKIKVKKESWLDGDTYNLSIGQGDIMITPIEVAAAFSAVANGGILYQPQIVKEITDSDNNIIKKFEPIIIKKDFVSSESLKIVKEGMRMAVTSQGAPSASSVLLNSLPVSSAAKTGTAQTPIKDHYHNWITVFAPYENPEIVLTIIIENVPGVQAAALPTAYNILNWYFSQK